jgi:hypothetical protein
MEAKVALDAVGGEEHFALACEDKQEPVQRLKQNTRLKNPPMHVRIRRNTFRTETQ